MKPDPILEEVWRAKDELAKRFGYDIHRLAEYLRSKETSVLKSPPAKRRVQKPRATRKAFR